FDRVKHDLPRQVLLNMVPGPGKHMWRDECQHFVWTPSCLSTALAGCFTRPRSCPKARISNTGSKPWPVTCLARFSISTVSTGRRRSSRANTTKAAPSMKPRRRFLLMYLAWFPQTNYLLLSGGGLLDTLLRQPVQIFAGAYAFVRGCDNWVKALKDA